MFYLYNKLTKWGHKICRHLTTIGTHPTCDLILVGLFIAEFQARLIHNGETLSIINLAENLTFAVNGIHVPYLVPIELPVRSIVQFPELDDYVVCQLHKRLARPGDMCDEDGYITESPSEADEVS